MMADKQMGHASSSCAAGGGCWLACRKCGGVVGAGDGKGSGCVVMAVVTGLVGTRGVVPEMLSPEGLTEVKSMAVGCCDAKRAF